MTVPMVVTSELTPPAEELPASRSTLAITVPPLMFMVAVSPKVGETLIVDPVDPVIPPAIVSKLVWSTVVAPV